MGKYSVKFVDCCRDCGNSICFYQNSGEGFQKKILESTFRLLIVQTADGAGKSAGTWSLPQMQPASGRSNDKTQGDKIGWI